jgi:hypothetical protein
LQTLVTSVLGTQPQWPLARAVSILWYLWLGDELQQTQWVVKVTGAATQSAVSAVVTHNRYIKHIVYSNYTVLGKLL